MMILQQYHIIKMLVAASNTTTIHLFDWNTPLTFLKVHMVGENARALWNFLALLSDFTKVLELDHPGENEEILT